jgi:ribosomal protein S3AE
MAQQKTTKVLVKRRKFIDVEIPIIKSNIELIGSSATELENKTIKLDLTRQLKGKSVEAIIKIKLVDNKAFAYPIKIKLMPYFIRRMIRKRISYVEDSFKTKSQESLIEIKPFLITRKRVSRAIRKTLRNKAKNWLEDYIMERKDSEIFTDILTNRLQKSLSLVLKKTYPLSLCEIRVLEINRTLSPEEVPKIEKKKQEKPTESVVDQLKELEDEKIKHAEEEIKETQQKAIEIVSEEKPKKTRAKKK